MVTRPLAQELIVGASIDPVFGPVLLFGQGGTAVEVLADRAIALPPLNRVLAARARLAHARRQAAGRLPRPSAGRARRGLRRADRAVADAGRPARAGRARHQPAAGRPRRRDRARCAPAREPQPAAGAERFAITPYPAELAETVAWQGETIAAAADPPRGRAAAPSLHRAACSREDLRLRFFSARRELPRSELARLTQIDYAREMAFIARAVPARRHGADARRRAGRRSTPTTSMPSSRSSCART